MVQRLAVLSDDLSSNFGEAAELAAELGVSGLAVRHVNGRNISELDRSSVVAVRRAADQHGVAISTVSSPLGRDLSLTDDLGPTLALVDKMADCAELLGTKLVRFFACWIKGKEAVEQWWDRPDLTAVLPPLVDRLSALADRAERAGVTLMLELEGASYAGQVAEARTLMAEVDSSSLSLCWDVCNGWWSGEHPTAGLGLALGMPLADVQFKDVRSQVGDATRPGRVQVELGCGDIDYAAIVSALRGADYQGWYTAERVYHPRRPEIEQTLQTAMIADLRQLATLLT
jgi:sugar phosphate isomerase/epimerase